MVAHSIEFKGALQTFVHEEGGLVEHLDVVSTVC